MPNYEYKCDECDHSFERLLKIAQYKDPQDCPECGHGPAKKMITGGTGFILRGDGWAGKNGKIKSQMRQKNQRLTSKQNEMKRDAPSVTLTPNVAGQQVDSWGEASKLAKSKGKDTSGYDRLARKERK